jgi:hypothetical protein
MYNMLEQIMSIVHITPELEKQIIKLYPTKIGCKAITKITGVQRTMIWRTVKKYNLPRNRAKYTKEQIQFIKDNYPDKGTHFCSETLKIPVDRVMQLASINGVKLTHTKGVGCRNWKGYGEIGASFWSRIKKSAEEREFCFQITIEDAWDLFIKQNKRCALSGVPLAFSPTSKYSLGNASLDRIDSSKGYMIKNVQWVHKDVNMMKQDWDDNGFIQWCHVISEFNKASRLRPKTLDNHTHYQLIDDPCPVLSA